MLIPPLLLVVLSTNRRDSLLVSIYTADSHFMCEPGNVSSDSVTSDAATLYQR